MIKPFSLLLLAGIQISSIQPYAHGHPAGQGCPCHCATDLVVFWDLKQRAGPADRFAASGSGKWVDGWESPSKEFRTTQGYTKIDLLVLLGSSAKGIWAVEARTTERGDIYSDLVCMTIDGRRKVFPLMARGSAGLSNLVSAIYGRL